MLNEWHGIGHLGRDPETRNFDDGGSVCNFSIACSKKIKDKKTGETKEVTEWVRIVVWGQQSIFCSTYLHKGSLVYVRGELTTRKWQDKNGQDRYTTEIVANRVQCLDKRDSQGDGQIRGQSDGQTQEPAQTPAGNVRAAFEMDDQVPFS